MDDKKHQVPTKVVQWELRELRQVVFTLAIQLHHLPADHFTDAELFLFESEIDRCTDLLRHMARKLEVLDRRHKLAEN